MLMKAISTKTLCNNQIQPLNKMHISVCRLNNVKMKTYIQYIYITARVRVKIFYGQCYVYVCLFVCAPAIPFFTMLKWRAGVSGDSCSAELPLCLHLMPVKDVSVKVSISSIISSSFRTSLSRCTHVLFCLQFSGPWNSSCTIKQGTMSTHEGRKNKIGQIESVCRKKLQYL